MKDKYIAPWLKSYSEQMNVRMETREKMHQEEISPYKNGLKPNVLASDLIAKYGQLSKEEIAPIAEGKTYRLGGRALLVRSFGKAAFVQFDDGSARFQIYVRKEDLTEESVAEYQHLDYGDIIFAEGEVFKTNKGELSLHARKFSILTKSLRPLPEKFHGLSDPELRYRMRYVDMIVNPEVREVLRKRSEVIRYIREFFYQREYLEVETPMLHSVAGGAAARPFKTHHNALSMDMFMRIAPELHLKRLVVGGYQRVFEINRCFRNEGLSLKHNPEFTTIEFYEAFATYWDLMDLTENLLNGIATEVFQKEMIQFGEREISFAKPFVRMTMREAVCKYTKIEEKESFRNDILISLLLKKGHAKKDLDQLGAGRLLNLCFEEYVEANLIQPTFITEFPTEISPLARRNDQNGDIVDRFELFINGWEVANAFSELNNPTDQLERFAEQAMLKEAGDEEATDVDYDYVRALEYGMPPTAGEGIGIDRLCMILTNSPTIRDVILFPQLKKEVFFQEEEEDALKGKEEKAEVEKEAKLEKQKK